ncbi:MAG TPA: ferrous iron transport protein B [Methylomirabilota bacterium]|nr:ferrous iron transport protein B [Methylomirabilota bacterium]
MRTASESSPVSAPSATAFVVLTGNPNCGKTTLFNALTGLRAKVGNYAGVTVERKEGRMLGTAPKAPITVLDLPGTYSLSPQSLDEQISRDVLLQHLPEVPKPDLVVVVVDASNLERNLYYATQVIELGYPTILALNMVDVAEQNGVSVSADRLQELLGVPVIPIVASIGQGLPALRNSILERAHQRERPAIARELIALPAPLQKEVSRLAGALKQKEFSPEAAALLLISDEKAKAPASLEPELAKARTALEAQSIDWRSAAIEARYNAVAEIHREVVEDQSFVHETFSDKLDRVLTHKVWGMLIFLGIMALMFQSIFTFAEWPMTWLEEGVNWVGQRVGGWLPPGDLQSLLVDGMIAGVGAVVVFLPQICLLFLFIGLLEDTGYMARAAFLMDRLMSKVGLHGKSFIPMLSSFACAIPGIMATRTIETPKDRLVTMLVAPLMSCSARLPVYTLLIAACIPQRDFGFFGSRGLTMLAMYLLGLFVALGMAWIFKKTLLRGETPFLIMELPPYKKPVLKVVLRHMADRAMLFLKRAGSIILGISILLWFLVSYPRNAAVEQTFEARRTAIEQRATTTADGQPDEATQAALSSLEAELGGERLRNSFAGRAGHFIEPLIRPLGFDWKIGIGIVASFAAREVFVSTMSTVYNVASGDDEEATKTVAETLQQQQRQDGTRLYTPLLGVTLMVFYVLALQCVSTVAVMRRETNSWKWPVFQWVYMGALAWIFAFITYQGGRLLGFQ